MGLCATGAFLSVVGFQVNHSVGAVGFLLKASITALAFLSWSASRRLDAELAAEAYTLQVMDQPDRGAEINASVVREIRVAQESFARRTKAVREGSQDFDAMAFPSPPNMRQALADVPGVLNPRHTVVTALQEVGLRCVSREDLELARVEDKVAAECSLRLAPFDDYCALAVRLGFAGSLIGIIAQAASVSGTSSTSLMSGDFLFGILTSAMTTVQGLLTFIYVESLYKRHRAALEGIRAGVIAYARQFVLPVFNQVPNDPVQVTNIVEGAVARLAGELEDAVTRLRQSMNDSVGVAAGEGRKLIREALDKALGEHLLTPTRAIMLELRQHLDETRNGLEATSRQMQLTAELLATEVRAPRRAPDSVVAAVTAAAAAFESASKVFLLNSSRMQKSSREIADHLREASAQVGDMARTAGNRAELSALSVELRARIERLEAASQAISLAANRLTEAESSRQYGFPANEPTVSDFRDLGRGRVGDRAR